MTAKRTDLTGITFGILIDENADESQNSSCNFVRQFGGNVVACHVPAPPENLAIKEFAHRLITGGIDLTIFQTVAGTKRILDKSFRTVTRQRLFNSLSDTMTLCANDRISKVLCRHGVDPTIVLESACTWKGVLTALDQYFLSTRNGEASGLAGLTVAIEENQAIHSLAAGLEARGSTVFRIPVFRRSALDNAFLRATQNEFEAFFALFEHGDVHSILFESPEMVAGFVDQVNRLRSMIWHEHVLIDRVVVAVGGDTEEILTDCGIAVDAFSTPENMSKSGRSFANDISAIHHQKNR